MSLIVHSRLQNRSADILKRVSPLMPDGPTAHAKPSPGIQSRSRARYHDCSDGWLGSINSAVPSGRYNVRSFSQLPEDFCTSIKYRNPATPRRRQRGARSSVKPAGSNRPGEKAGTPVCSWKDCNPVKVEGTGGGPAGEPGSTNCMISDRPNRPPNALACS